MKPFFSVGLLFLLSWSYFFRPAPNAGTPLGPTNGVDTALAGQLVLFTQPADTHFLRTTLPQLRELARRNNLEWIERDATAGAPAEVTATPALFYRNGAGYAQFGGRYIDIAAIENFVRVNCIRPKAPAVDERRQILLHQRGRQRTVIPLKITEQKGPFGGASPDWRAGLMRAMAAQPAYAEVAQVELWPTDRRYYLDVHPYVAADGTVFLSAAIFSQFDCIHAIWDNFSAPLRGRVGEPGALFERLATQAMAVIAARGSDFAAGDALQPIPADLPAWDWSLLPPPPAAPDRDANGLVDLLGRDRYTTPRPILAAVPMLQFSFPAPLDRYAGEVRELEGTLRVDTVAHRLSGEFIARVKTLTMGMAELDAKVLKSYLRAKKYPRAWFRFAEIPIPPGYDGQQPLDLVIPGVFTMIGREENVQVQTRLQPALDTSGRPALEVSASFSLDIADPFGLTGPDGPAEIKNRLDFQLNFQLQG